MSSFTNPSIGAAASLLDYTDRDVPEDQDVEDIRVDVGAPVADRTAINAKAAQYSRRGGELSSDEDSQDEGEGEAPTTTAATTGIRESSDPEADEGSTDGLDSSSEDRAARYATLGAGNDGDDDEDFDDFQAAPPDATFIRSSVTTTYTTMATVRQPKESAEVEGGGEGEDEDEDEDEDAAGLPAAPGLVPMIAPLTAAKIDTIKSAMATLKFSPRPGSGIDAFAARLLGQRVGDEKQKQTQTERGGQ